MKQLSFWAKDNPRLARTIIVFSHIFIVLNALFLGFFTYATDIKLSYGVLIILATTFLLAYILYPIKRKESGLFKYSYLRQKSTDFLLVITYSLIITFGFNHFAFSPDYSRESAQPKALLIVHKVTPDAKPDKKEKRELRKTMKELRKNIKTEIRALKKEFKEKGNNEMHVGLKILLALLTVGVAIFLGYVVAALACSLSCSGNEGLALATLILGWGGIIFLGVIAIKEIFKNRSSIGEGESPPNP
jgi:hypothetical protein